MRIMLVDDVIKECKGFLGITNSYGTEIEAYLTRYLLILVCSSFEEEFEKIFIERAKKAKDDFSVNYITSVVPDVLKSVGINKLSNFIGKFGTSYHNKFVREVSETSIATYYSNIMMNRHKVAHEDGQISMTFNEVVDAYEKSHVVLDKVYEIINNL